MNWQNNNQSTPKLLPPTAFEGTNNETNKNNNDVSKNESVDSSESYLLAYGNDGLQLIIENLKLQNQKLGSENEILTHRNKGTKIFFLVVFFLRDFDNALLLYHLATGPLEI